MTVIAQRTAAAPSAGDEETEKDRFGVVHRRHCDGTWRYLRRLGLTPAEADDATQQVFLVIARKLGAVKPGAERAYVYEVASRVASDVKRAAARRYEVCVPAEHAETGNGPDDLLEERRRLALLDTILGGMPEELRQVFALYEIEELSMREIASVISVPQGTVASRLRRARELFKDRAARHRKGATP